VIVEPALLERERARLPELPAARRARFRDELGLPEPSALAMTASRALADFFEQTARLSGAPLEAANWIANDVAAFLADPEIEAERIEDLPLAPGRLAEVIALVARGELHKNGGRAVLRAMLASAKPAAELVRELGLAQVSDATEIERWCRAALAGQDAVVADVLQGRTKALGALIGPVMKASGGRANPRLVQETLLRLIREGAAR
jgi:aspartyl-tRNA(Asn)/glutamyl-tRNA(Gln) amidotransferase subunit B